MTVLHFLRHGEVDNPDNVYYGRLPGFPLTRSGEQCIAYMADQLVDQPIEAIYCSPLLRTEQSAEILAKRLGLRPQIDDRLIEIATLYEGKSRGRRATVPHYPVAKGGYAETMAEIYDRMAHFVRDVAELHPSGHVVSVSHNGPIHILQLGLEGRPLTEALLVNDPIPTCGMETVVTVNGSHIAVARRELACPIAQHRV